MGTSALCISLLFSLFLFHGVEEVEASRRLYTNDRSRHFKLHYTLMNGVVSNNSESTPPLIKSPPPVKDSTQSGLPHVVVIVLLCFALIALTGLGIWFICFKGRRHESANHVPNSKSQDAATTASGHTGSTPASTYSTAPSSTTNERESDGSVPGRKSSYDVTHNASSHHAPMKNTPSTQLASRHTPTATSVSEIRKPNRRPSRVAEFGLTAFTYEELRDATNNFSQANFLGEGGFAKVYKGSLSENRKVAVKLLKNENSKAEREFRNEVDIISRVRHINIVTLIGYCITESKRLIVYEFVENKSLDDHLRGGKDLQFMDWPIRMKIAQGAAKGLAYLHEECGDQNIIHRDVKPANILLDSSFVAKVADFGISKLCPNSFESYIATYVIGSVGFIDPFYYETKELSFKSDVYSFGVVLLELISGETHLPKVQELKSKIHRALKHRNFDTIVDPKLENYNLDEMTLMVTCVEACLRKDPKDRPPMSKVTRVLEKVTSLDELKMKTRSRRG